MWKYHTYGLSTFLTLGPSLRSIADDVCPLQEQVEIKDDNRVSQQQWTLYVSLALIQRKPLNSREWFHTE